MSALIIINGEEEFLKERAAFDEASSSLIDSVYQYIADSELNKYRDESQMLLLSGGSRAFILWGVEDIPELPAGESDLLIAVAQKKVLTDARAKRIHNFQKFKTFDDNNQVVKWILDEGNALNIDLNDVARALFVSHGRSLRKISSEIKKLAVLSPSGGIVTPEIAKSVICFSAELTPRDIVDSICDGQVTRALAFYDKLQDRTDETGWIIAYLQRHVLQQIRVQALLARKISDNQIASILGIHPFMYRKTVAPRANLWSNESLVCSLDVLCSLDVAHKQGDDCAKFGLEAEIIRLAEETKNGKRHGSSN